jgi:hypothetical protein
MSFDISSLMGSKGADIKMLQMADDKGNKVSIIDIKGDKGNKLFGGDKDPLTQLMKDLCKPDKKEEERREQEKATKMLMALALVTALTGGNPGALLGMLTGDRGAKS